jgi:hypothetical protein
VEKGIMPHPEMTTAGAGQKGDCRQSKEIKWLIPGKGKKLPDHREIAMKLGSFRLTY